MKMALRDVLVVVVAHYVMHSRRYILEQMRSSFSCQLLSERRWHTGMLLGRAEVLRVGWRDFDDDPLCPCASARSSPNGAEMRHP